MSRARRALVLVCVATSSCSVDDRALVEAEGSGGEGADGAEAGDAGESSEAGASGDASSAGTGGAGASGGNGGSASGPCPDLDENGVLDCTESLVENPSFDADESGWRLDQNVIAEWDAFDATARADSGSLRLENAAFLENEPTLSAAGATQCVAASPERRFSLYAQAHIQAERVIGYAGVSAFFYETLDCSGALLRPGVSPQIGTISQWQTLSFTVDSPEGARSVLIKLVAAKPYDEETFSVRFDNVLVKASAISD